MIKWTPYYGDWPPNFFETAFCNCRNDAHHRHIVNSIHFLSDDMSERMRWTIDWIFFRVAISNITCLNNNNFWPPKKFEVVAWAKFCSAMILKHSELVFVLLHIINVYDPFYLIFVFKFFLQMKYNHKIPSTRELEGGRVKSHFTHHLIYCLIYSLEVKRVKTHTKCDVLKNK